MVSIMYKAVPTDTDTIGKLTDISSLFYKHPMNLILILPIVLMFKMTHLLNKKEK